MSDTFNPYRNWLGLNTEHPASHYELLGLRPFESDIQTITYAADRAINQLRGIRPGPYAAQWSQLLDQLSAARSCLTEPAQRSRYDHELQTRSPATASTLPTGPAGWSSGMPGQPAGRAAESNPPTMADFARNMYPPGMGSPGAPAAGPAPVTPGTMPPNVAAGNMAASVPGGAAFVGGAPAGQGPGNQVTTPASGSTATPAQGGPATAAESPQSVPIRPQPRSETPAMPPGTVPMSAPNDPSYYQSPSAVPMTGPTMGVANTASPYAMPNAAAGGGYDPSLPQATPGVYGTPGPVAPQQGVVPPQGIPAAQPWGTPQPGVNAPAAGQPYLPQAQPMGQTPPLGYPGAAAPAPDGYYYGGGQPAMGQPAYPQSVPAQPMPAMGGPVPPATPYAGTTVPQDPYAAAYPPAAPAPVTAPTPPAHVPPPDAPAERESFKPAHAAEGDDPMAPVNPLLFASGGTAGINSIGASQKFSPGPTATSKTPAAALPPTTIPSTDKPGPTSGAQSKPAIRRSTTLPIIIGAAVGGLAAVLIAGFLIFGGNSGNDDNGLANSRDDQRRGAGAVDHMVADANDTHDTADTAGAGSSENGPQSAKTAGGTSADAGATVDAADNSAEPSSPGGHEGVQIAPSSTTDETPPETHVPPTTTTDRTPPSTGGAVPFATSDGQDPIPEISPGTGGTTAVGTPTLPHPGASGLNPGATQPGPSGGGAPAATPSEGELAELGRALTRVKTALGAKDYLRASRELANAQRLARLPEHRAKVERLKKLVNYTQQFWDAFREGLQGVRATEEIVIGDSRVNVVEINPQRIILRGAGQSKTFPMTDLPSKLVVAIADRWFDQNDPAHKVMKGAYYATGPDANPTEARRLWDEAQRAGVAVGDLAEVLTDSYDLTRDLDR